MKLSTRTRYGLRALIDLGVYYKGKPVLVREIAKRQGVSERYLEHIMLSLKKAGILMSIKGGKGGYGFLKMPSDVSLMDIMEALEGPVFFVECVEKKEICGKSRSCAARDVWVKVKDEMRKVLGGITLQELIERQKEKGSKKGEVFYEI